MISKPLVQVVAGIVVLVFAVGILLDGGTLEAGWLRYYSAAVTVAIVAMWLWDRWIWRWKIVQRWNVVPRDLRGTWKGTLASQWSDPETGGRPADKQAYLVIRQTWSTVSVTQFTDESSSRSSLGKVSAGAGLSSLDYMYLNRPDSKVEHRSRMHHGSASFDVVGSPASRLKGRYWTDRDSRGEIDLRDRSRKWAEDYDSCEALFEVTPAPASRS